MMVTTHKTEAELTAESNGWPLDYACGYCDGQAAARHNVRDHAGLLGEGDSYAEGYRRGISSITVPERVGRFDSPARV